MHHYRNLEMEMSDLEMLVKMIVVVVFVMHVVEQIEGVVVEMDDLVLDLQLSRENLLEL
jgi:hypothetical protein